MRTGAPFSTLSVFDGVIPDDLAPPPASAPRPMASLPKKEFSSPKIYLFKKKPFSIILSYFNIWYGIISIVYI
jgi:hypothetical protein